MRIEIEIPKEFESDYKGDMFKDFFSRVLCDIENGTMCGNYEKETAEMFLKAFDESKPAYDVDAVAEKVYDLLSEHDISVWEEIDHIKLADEWVRIINNTYDKKLNHEELETRRMNALKEYLEKAGKDGAE